MNESTLAERFADATEGMDADEAKQYTYDCMDTGSLYAVAWRDRENMLVFSDASLVRFLWENDVVDECLCFTGVLSEPAMLDQYPAALAAMYDEVLVSNAAVGEKVGAAMH